MRTEKAKAIASLGLATLLAAMGATVGCATTSATGPRATAETPQEKATRRQLDQMSTSDGSQATADVQPARQKTPRRIDRHRNQGVIDQPVR